MHILVYVFQTSTTNCFPYCINPSEPDSLPDYQTPAAPRQENQTPLGTFPTLTVLKDGERISSKSYTFSSYLTGNTLRLRHMTNRLMLFREIIAVYCENHIKHKYAVGRKQHAVA
jgi:hypothetical protein